MSATKPVAYSYVRFSSPEQLKGDSRRRQLERTADWCKRHDVRLDESTTFEDLGKSAFLGKHRSNPDRHALAAFLQLVEKGRIARGSYLIVESLDRLTREDIQPALLLILGLLQAGVRIVQLTPAEMVYDDRSEAHAIMLMVVELMRGHSESKVKSERVGRAWGEKRKQARERGVPLTAQVPAWLQVRDGAFVPIPGRAAAVRRIFELSSGGFGELLISKRLTEEGYEPFGPSGKWQRAYVGKILRSRSVLGEFQPRRRHDGKPDGKPIADYFPRVVSDELWQQCRRAAAQRLDKPGRRGGHVNVFAGLLRDGVTGKGVVVSARKSRRAGTSHRVIVAAEAHAGRQPRQAFPFASFEAAVLSCLHEIKPHDILNGDHPDESGALAAELAAAESELAAAVAFMNERGFSRSIGERVAALEASQRDLAARLAVARQEAAHPLSESWGEAQSLIGALAADNGDELRMRLRSLLRRMTEVMCVVLVARGTVRLCAVQVWFAGGKRHRDYLIVHRAAKDNGRKRTAGGWSCRSLAEVARPGDLDLRRPADAAALARALAGMDLSRLE
jgi:DNA invertase Pin-like site-specific DNA recombinase